MDESEKKFQIVDKILLFEIAAFNDASQFAADFAFFIPAVGIAIGGLQEFEDLIVSAVVLSVFFYKMGFSGMIGLVQLVGTIVEFFGIPARTATVAISIYLANHPKVASVAEIATGEIPGIPKGVPVE